MVIVVAFSGPIDNIAAFRATHTKKDSVFVTQRTGNDTHTGFFIMVAVQRCHDFFFKLIFIFWFDNTVRIAPLQIDINVVASVGNSFCAFPVNFMEFIAIFIIFDVSVAEFFHNTKVNASVIAEVWRLVFRANLTVVRNNENSPAFINEMQEATDIVVGLFVDAFHQCCVF